MSKDIDWIEKLFKWADDNDIKGKGWKNKSNYSWITTTTDIDYDTIRTGIPRDRELLLKLTHLNLTRAQIKTLPIEICNLTNLVYLDLSNNKLVSLPEEIRNLNKLTSLNLNDNNIYEDDFKNSNILKYVITLKKLEHLYVRDNYGIKRVPDKIFDLTNLTILSLFKIQDTRNFYKILNLKKLKYLAIRHINELPKEVGSLINLQKLYLSYCEELPQEIGNLINLEELDLNDCDKLQKLPEAIGNLKNLLKLDLSYCYEIQELPESIGKLINLEKLDLHNCHNLKVLPNTIGNLTRLKKLNLSYCNELQELPESIENLTSLEELDLSGCHNLKILPNTIGNLNRLKKLDLSYSYELQKLPETIGNLTSLEELDLSGCDNLKELPKSKSNLINLKKFNGEKHFPFTEDKIQDTQKKENMPKLNIENKIYFGTPGTGKTYKLQQIMEDYYKHVMVTFHQSYGYEEFMEGLKAEIDDDKNVFYKVKDGIFKQICEEAQKNPEQHFAILIDEINRGNISKILGELITLIEISKRENTSTILPYSGDEFTVPKNLSIVATMNTADRSIAPIDTALRRRFDFIEMMPQPEMLNSNMDGVNLQKMLRAINTRIEYLYDKDHTIGHTYFLDIKNIDNLVKIMKKNIIPLLAEYFYEDWENIKLVLNNNFIDVQNTDNEYLNTLTSKVRNKKLYEIKDDNFTKEEFIKIYTVNE